MVRKNNMVPDINMLHTLLISGNNCDPGFNQCYLTKFFRNL